jgi:hypothetical protein
MDSTQHAIPVRSYHGVVSVNVTDTAAPDATVNVTVAAMTVELADVPLHFTAVDPTFGGVGRLNVAVNPSALAKLAMMVGSVFLESYAGDVTVASFPILSCGSATNVNGDTGEVSGIVKVLPVCVAMSPPDKLNVTETAPTSFVSRSMIC